MLHSANLSEKWLLLDKRNEGFYARVCMYVQVEVHEYACISMGCCMSVCACQCGGYARVCMHVQVEVHECACIRMGCCMSVCARSTLIGLKILTACSLSQMYRGKPHSLIGYPAERHITNREPQGQREGRQQVSPVRQ